MKFNIHAKLIGILTWNCSQYLFETIKTVTSFDGREWQCKANLKMNNASKLFSVSHLFKSTSLTNTIPFKKLRRLNELMNWSCSSSREISTLWNRNWQSALPVLVFFQEKNIAETQMSPDLTTRLLSAEVIQNS